MPAAIDITGQRFGRLVVLALHHIAKNYHRCWLCSCDCGKRKVVSWPALSQKTTVSCGCLRAEKAGITAKNRTVHGQARQGHHTRVFRCWVNMKDRCLNPKNKHFKDYGGRGIQVCERWRSFSNFFEDMGPCPDGYSIERIDVNGNYESANCKWIPMAEQVQNTRRAQRSRATQPGK
jgi:hypothetical protein